MDGSVQDGVFDGIDREFAGLKLYGGGEAVVSDDLKVGRLRWRGHAGRQSCQQEYQKPSHRYPDASQFVKEKENDIKQCIVYSTPTLR